MSNLLSITQIKGVKYLCLRFPLVSIVSMKSPHVEYVFMDLDYVAYSLYH